MISGCSADLNDARQDLFRAIRRPAGLRFKTPVGRVASSLCRASNEWMCPKMCPKSRPKFPKPWVKNPHNQRLYEFLTISRKLKWRRDRDSNPGNPLEAQRFSKPSRSTTPAPLRVGVVRPFSIDFRGWQEGRTSFRSHGEFH